MSNQKDNRVIARSKARVLTAEEMRQIVGGNLPVSTSGGTSVPSGDSVVVDDDVVVHG